MDYPERRGANACSNSSVYDGEVTFKQVIIQRFGAAAGSEAYDEPLTAPG
jgi:hypothetical protein